MEDDIYDDKVVGIKKQSFLSTDLWHEDNAGSSSASDRNSLPSMSKSQNVCDILKAKGLKSSKSKYLSKNTPKKQTFIK